MDELVKLAGDFFLPRQEQSNWCWAAVAVALHDYFKSQHLDQCSLVQAVRAPTAVDCCTHPSDSRCNAISAISSALAEIGISRRSEPPQPQGTLAFHTIREDLERDRPLICLMSGVGAQGDHYVIIVGCFLRNGVPWLLVDDPAEGVRREVRFSHFFSFGGRRWAQTTRLQ
jgi:hypothetical protein